MEAIDPYSLDPIVEGHGQDVNRDQESDDRLESPTTMTQDDPELRHLLADADLVRPSMLRHAGFQTIVSQPLNATRNKCYSMPNYFAS